MGRSPSVADRATRLRRRKRGSVSLGFLSPHLLAGPGRLGYNNRCPSSKPRILYCCGQLTVEGSIGGLYCLNTLGAALSAIGVGFVAFYFFEINSAIYAAVLINFSVSSIALMVAREPQ